MITIVEAEQLAQLERFANGAAPYGSGNPVPPAGTRLPGYMTAQQHLADALEGAAPALARDVADKLTKAKALELADAIRRAVDRAVRSRRDAEVASRLAVLVGVVEAGLDGIPAECEAIEPRDYVSEWLDETGGSLPDAADRTCRGCGCTNDDGCELACWWVEPDLCSNCQLAPEAVAPWEPHEPAPEPPPQPPRPCEHPNVCDHPDHAEAMEP